MAYKSKFLHFKTKASYDAERAKTTAGTEERKVFDAYISFIDEGLMICTWGKEYKCDISASEVEALVNAGKISPATVAPLIAGTAAVGTSTKYAREDHRHPEQVNITGNAATATTATNLASAPSFIKNGNTIKITVGNKTSTEFTIPYASKTSAAETLMYGRDIILDGDVTGSTTKSFNGSKNVTINTTISTINAEKLTGIINVDRLPEIPIEKLPAGALERMFVVESQTAAIDAVKAGTIQEGDVVQIGNGGLMYFCIDDAATTFRNAFKEFTAGSATSVPWSGVTNAPTKLSQFTNDSGFTTNKGTVTSVAMSVPTGLSISGSPITASGTLALSYTSGYSIPTTAKQTNWDTAYGWGNHASAGYAKTTQLANYLPLSGGTLNGSITLNRLVAGNNLTETAYNTTDVIALSKYRTPIVFYSVQSNAWTCFQFENNNTILFGNDNAVPIKFYSSGKSAVYATEFYQDESLVATQSWVTGKGYLTSVPAQTWASITGKPTFAAVATSGSYNDLTNKPTIPSAYTLPTASSTVLGGVKIGSGISISSGVISATYTSVGAAAASHTHTASQVTGLATVATSGSYNDLTNKPSIPSLSGYATQSWVTSQGYLTSIPAATSSAYGGIQIGYTTSGKNYAVQLSNGKAYVNVPWTDTNTTYSAGTNISISGTTINCTYSYTLPTASSSVLGGVKVGSNITVSSGTISLSKSNVTSALGYTPANTSDIPEIPIALPNPYALTINGTSYTGSSAVSINTARILSTSTLSSSTVSAGYSYNNTSSRTISSLSGFSSSNPDSVIISTAKLTFTASNAIKMDGLADLSGTYYIYCLSYMANGKIAVNGAVYA